MEITYQKFFDRAMKNTMAIEIDFVSSSEFEGSTHKITNQDALGIFIISMIKLVQEIQIENHFGKQN